MDDPEDNSSSSETPAEQQGCHVRPSSPTSTSTQHLDHVLTARRFLQDDQVRAASREKKIAFLQSKGVKDSIIKSLLEDHENQAEKNVASADVTQSTAQEDPETTRAPINLMSSVGRPPIVTYPEFLTKPLRPPPLVTTGRLLAIFYTFTGLSNLLLGTNKYYFAPMIFDLTSSRSELYATACRKLQSLTAKLMEAVSDVSLGKPEPAFTDETSDAEDPTEMFHRDIGVQTSFPANLVLKPTSPTTKHDLEYQLDRLSGAVRSVSRLKNELYTQSEDLEDIRTLLDLFRDELDVMTYSSQSHFMTGFNLCGASPSVEPEDEILKIRDSIRRVKGVLLSSRTFPASTR